MKFTWKTIAALRIFATALSLFMFIMLTLHKSSSPFFYGAFILFMIASITTSLPYDRPLFCALMKKLF